MSNKSIDPQELNKAQLAKLRVLVVDDQMMMRTMISQDLKSMGFVEVATASNGDDAWAQIEDARRSRHPFNILFMDWNMPGLDGLGVLRKCRNEAHYDDMAIVMVTAEDRKTLVLEAIQLGASSYIIKPVSRVELQKNVARVCEWLEKRGTF